MADPYTIGEGRLSATATPHRFVQMTVRGKPVVVCRFCGMERTDKNANTACSRMVGDFA